MKSSPEVKLISNIWIYSYDIIIYVDVYRTQCFWDILEVNTYKQNLLTILLLVVNT